MAPVSGGEQLEFAAALPASRRSAPLPVLDQRARGTTFHALTVRSVLNAPAATGMGFWSLNPYIGCEFGCTYCYARETHKWAVERAERREELSIDDDRLPIDPAAPNRQSTIVNQQSSLPAWLAFERQILVKQGAAEVLARTLDPHKLAGHSLVIGTATDPYQPAERSFQLTRQILERLTAYRGLSIGLITKSPLVVRDLDLLQRLTARHEVTVNISLATLDARLLRRIEARSPAPHARLRALRALTTGGIHAGMLIAPVLPGITDSRASLAALMAAGKAAGARYVVGTALRLGPAARARFLPHLAQEFPELVERYQRRYGPEGGPGVRQYVGKDYQAALSRRLRALQRQYGFPVDERPTGTPLRKSATEPAASRVDEEMRRWRQLEGRAPREIPALEQETLWAAVSNEQ
ncbi:MAG: radical SAM protein [Gemmatimonadales bacterium]